MQNRLLLLLITLIVSFSTQAATCPPVDQINIAKPPVGWKVLLPPQIEDQEYHFTKAIHSYNPNFFYQHVICVYEADESFFPPSFELISDATYAKPNTVTETWNEPAIIDQTIMCAPEDYDPMLCKFE
ncbi:MAG: hypothetical protein V4501_02605 [Pseudomonadota bacterium]